MKVFKSKICVCYHRPAFLPKGDCFVPMWGGKSIADKISKEGTVLSVGEKNWMSEHCMGDDTGDNISKENRKYSEVTVLYWVWKNYDKIGNPDYIGFMQYRRHFCLNKEYAESYNPDVFNQIYVENIFEGYQEKIGLTDENVQKILNRYDGVVACNDTYNTIRFYLRFSYIEYLKYYDTMLEIIDNDWPQYAQAAHQYDKGTYHAWSQCFIVKKEWFMSYCIFLFDVLKKIDVFCKNDYQKFDLEKQRILGYIAEIMWGIYWQYLTSRGLKFLSVPLVVNKKPFLSV